MECFCYMRQPPQTLICLELDIYELEELTRLVANAPYTAVARKLYVTLTDAAKRHDSPERKGA